MIHVIATVETVRGKREDFLKEFHRLMPLVHAEKGCVEYGPTVDVASGIAIQGALRDDFVTIIEKWSDLEALKVHLAAEHMKEYRARVKDFVVKTQLQVLQPA